MAEKIRLQVDLADPDDLRAKISEAEEIHAQKVRSVKEAEKDAEHWRELVANLKQLAGIVSVDEVTSSGRPSPAQDAVVRIVERVGRPMRPIEVARRLKAEGHEVKSNAAVNAALYAAAEAGRLRRPADRQYAPLLKKAKKIKKVTRKAAT